MNTKQHNSFGEYHSLIRINGRRSVIGAGHTVREAEIHALQAASEVWPHHSHIFDLLTERGSKALVSV